MQSPKFELDNNTTIDNKHPSLRTVLYATREDREKVCNFRVLLQLLKDSLSPSIHWTHHALGISQHYETVNLVSFLTVWLCLVKEMTTKDINKKRVSWLRNMNVIIRKLRLFVFLCLGVPTLYWVMSFQWSVFFDQQCYILTHPLSKLYSLTRFTTPNWPNNRILLTA